MEITIESHEQNELVFRSLRIAQQDKVGIFCLTKNDPASVSGQLMKAIIFLLSEQELDDLLAEHGYVNRDNLIGGGL